MKTQSFYWPESGLKKISIRNVGSTFYKQSNAQNNLNNDVIVLCKQGQLREALRMLRTINQNADSFTYASLLQACIKKKAFSDAKLVHTLLEKSGIIPDKFLRNTLINLYVKYGSLVDARRLFDEMPERDVRSWTAMVAAYSRNGCAEEALALFRRMKKAGIQPNHFTFASVLPACAKLANLQQGIEVHEEILSSGIECDAFVENAIIDMYAKCGRIEKARDVFDKMRHRDVVSWNTMIAGYAQNGLVDEGLRLFQKMPEPDIISWNAMIASFAQNGFVDEAFGFFKKMRERNVVSWNAMIAGYVQNGHGDKALNLLHLMQRKGVKPDLKTFSSVLQACAVLAALEQGVQIHEEMVRCGIQIDEFVENSLVDMYAKCGRIEKARELFDKMSRRNVISWNTMIAGYEQSGEFDEALNLFHQMPEPDVVSCTIILTAYMQNGRVDDALKLFQRMPEQDVASWTALISGYVQNGRSVEALSLFGQMQVSGVLPEPKTYVCILPACADLAALEQGIQIHEEICERGFASNVFLANVLLDMYAKCGSIERARELFDKMHQPDIVSWNAMITGYAQNGLVDEALKLFKQMPERDAFSWTGMIAGYAQNGLLEEALKLFNEMPHRTVVSWNAMISGLAHHDRGTEALKLFEQMQSAGVKPNSNTFVGILSVCANLAVLEQGMQIHEKIMRYGFQSLVPVANAVVDMYAKCGCIKKAREVFDEIPQRNVVSWTTMIVAYAMHGFGREALVLFEQMIEDGMMPDNITFVGVLTACSRAGLVNEGYGYFNQMTKKYNILPILEHYRCMVDLLGRAGHLDEALDFINGMPLKPDAVLWICLLGACRLHNNVKLAECAAEHISELDPQNTAPYVLLSNIYAAAGRWSDIAKLRKMMKDRGLKKTPGCSWIEVNNQVHAFFVGDGIDAKLQNAIQKG